MMFVELLNRARALISLQSSDPSLLFVILLLAFAYITYLRLRIRNLNQHVGDYKRISKYLDDQLKLLYRNFRLLSKQMRESIDARDADGRDRK